MRPAFCFRHLLAHAGPPSPHPERAAALVADTLAACSPQIPCYSPGEASSRSAGICCIGTVVGTMDPARREHAHSALTRASTTEKLSRTFHGPPLDIAEMAGPRCAAAALIAPWPLPETSLVGNDLNDFTTRPRCAHGGLRGQPYDGRGTHLESRTHSLAMLHQRRSDQTRPTSSLSAHHPRGIQPSLLLKRTRAPPAIFKLFLPDPQQHPTTHLLTIPIHSSTTRTMMRSVGTLGFFTQNVRQSTG